MITLLAVAVAAAADELVPAAAGSATGSPPDSATPGAYGVLVVAYGFVASVITIIEAVGCCCC